MTDEPSAERCEACGHEESEHTLGEKADRSVGMQATGPYCEGGTNCLCMGAIWFEKIRTLRAENGRLGEDFAEMVELHESAVKSAARLGLREIERTKERDAAREERDCLLEDFHEMEGEANTLRDERDAARTELERVRAAGKEIEAALGSVLLVVEMEMRKAMSRENAIVELSSMQDYCRSIGPSISKARRVLGEGQK